MVEGADDKRGFFVGVSSEMRSGRMVDVPAGAGGKDLGVTGVASSAARLRFLVEVKRAMALSYSDALEGACFGVAGVTWAVGG